MQVRNDLHNCPNDRIRRRTNPALHCSLEAVSRSSCECGSSITRASMALTRRIGNEPKSVDPYQTMLAEAMPYSEANAAFKVINRPSRRSQVHRDSGISSFLRSSLPDRAWRQYAISGQHPLAVSLSQCGPARVSIRASVKLSLISRLIQEVTTIDNPQICRGRRRSRFL